MDDILRLRDRIENSISLGESHFREFKSAYEGRPDAKRPRAVKEIARDIGEALVAFANADGGELIVGVEDDGRITGIPHDETDVVQLLNAVQTHVKAETPLPIEISRVVQIEPDKRILFFQVAKGTTEIYQLPDGRCVVRKEKSTVPGVIKQIQFERQEVRSREFDRQFVDGATTTDLDIPLLQSIADSFIRGLSPERYLQQMGLAEYGPGGLRLRMAALLLFAKDIQRWHPYCQVRILRVEGTTLGTGQNYNVTSDEFVRGNIFHLLNEAWEQLRPYLTIRTEFGADATFQQRYTYPQEVCKEALVNAIAHRDYSIQSGIEVFVYTDRLEVRNPGALLSTMTIHRLEELEGAHESRNALVARVLRENNFMRELGEGIRRIFEQMEQNELAVPKLYSNKTFFSVTLYNRSLFNEKQQRWLEAFSSFNLSNLQKRIVALGMDDREISPDDIYRAMGTRDRNIYDVEVTGLRNQEILVQTRTPSAATQVAKLRKIPKQAVGRFKLQIPSEADTKNMPVATAVKAMNDAKVYIGNLHYTVTQDDLQTLLEEHRLQGIQKIELPLQGGHARGFAFVQFDTPSHARQAIEALNDQSFMGLNLKAKPFQPK